MHRQYSRKSSNRRSYRYHDDYKYGKSNKRKGRYEDERKDRSIKKRKVVGDDDNKPKKSEEVLKAERLEAWKKKMKDMEIQNNIKQFVEKKKEEVSHTNPVKIEISQKEGMNVFKNDNSKEIKKNISKKKSNVFSLFEPSKEEKKKEDEKKTINVEEEEDSLDQFFKVIDKELDHLNDLEESKRGKVITMDEILTTKTNDNSSITTNINFLEEEINISKEDKAFHEVLVRTLKENVEIEKTDYFKNEDSFITESIIEFEDEEIKQKSIKKDLKKTDHSTIYYPSFRKNFYMPTREISSMSQEEIIHARSKLGKIVLRGENIPTPVRFWKQCGLNDVTLSKLKDFGYPKPYAIQAQAIPCIMSGRNVIGIAPTGSGKTLAFILPLIRHILDQPKLQEGDGPIGLIIAPTRELALQIYKEFRKFGRPLNLRSCCAFGGGNMSEQIAKLKVGVHAVVCTPGRMIDLLCANRGRVTNFRRVTYAVLDEADRMFDFGFGPQITRLLGNVRPDKQMVLFSATFPKPLEALARQVLSKDCIEIIVGGRSVANEKITQFVEVRDEGSKFLRLLELLGIWYGKGSILIFVKEKADTGLLFKDLYASGYDSLVLHSGMDQFDRMETLGQFKKGEKTILIGTSLVARGIDVQDIELVVNYDVPNHFEDYVHQVGRTARGDKEGTAYTFLKPDEEEYSIDMIKGLSESGNIIPKSLLEMKDRFLQKKKNGLKKDRHTLFGFTGSGFGFNENENDKNQKEVKRQMKSLGIDDDGNIIQDDSFYGKGDKITNAEKAKIVSKLTKNEKKNSIGSSVNQAKAFAMSLTIQASLSEIRPKTGFSAEIDINDYPQKARWKVTRSNSEDLYAITDETSCNVTPKGVYVAKGSTLPFGERKLYLLVEGKNESDVDRCKMKLLSLLENSSQQRYDPRLAKLQKYSIF